MGLVPLFTYLKIILLRYFQFSVFSNKQYSNRLLVGPTIQSKENFEVSLNLNHEEYFKKPIIEWHALIFKFKLI